MPPFSAAARFLQLQDKEINFPLKASPGRGKLSPKVTDEGAGQQHFALNTPHPALRATSPQGVKAFALGQASKIDFCSCRKLSLDFVPKIRYNSNVLSES